MLLDTFILPSGMHTLIEKKKKLLLFTVVKAILIFPPQAHS